MPDSSCVVTFSAEVEGDPLIFFLKLEDGEIRHGQKLERDSITLMSHALNPPIKPGLKDSGAYLPDTLWYHPRFSLLCSNNNPWDPTTIFPKHGWTRRVLLFCECWRHLKWNQRARELLGGCTVYYVWESCAFMTPPKNPLVYERLYV